DVYKETAWRFINAALFNVSSLSRISVTLWFTNLPFMVDMFDQLEEFIRHIVWFPLRYDG
ncbi:hypothetical protein CWN50_17890, partial [Klebsiella michiganensis]